MQTYAGIDLHSSNCYLAVIDEQQRRLYSKRLPNSLDHILTALQPFKEGLSGVVVESTYNGYWLVDGLQEQGYIYPESRAAGPGPVASPAVVRASPHGAHSQFAEHGATLLRSWDLGQ